MARMRGVSASLGDSPRLDAAPRAAGTSFGDEPAMTIRPAPVNAFEFVVVAALRAQQLLAGCTPRVAGSHNAATLARMEVAEGRVVRIEGRSPAGLRQCGWQL